MKIALIISILVASMSTSCDINGGNDNRNDLISVPNGNFQYTPLDNWKLAYEISNENNYIHNAVYEIKSDKKDTTVAVVSIFCSKLDIGSPSVNQMNHIYELTTFQKIFQTKYGLDGVQLTKVFDKDKSIYCNTKGRIYFKFKNEDLFIECNLLITVLTEPDLYEEPKMVNEFDQFIKTYSKR